MTKWVAAAEAKAKLSELMARVAHGGERIVIERHGKPMVALVSIEDLDKLHGQKGRADEADPWSRLAEAAPSMDEDEVIDQMVELIYADRARNIAPPLDTTGWLDDD